MIETVRLRLKPEETADSDTIKIKINEQVREKVNDFHITRKSIDARQKQVWIDVEFIVATGEDMSATPETTSINVEKTTKDSPQVIIVGAGPAGLFAGLSALEHGWRPIIVERGKSVEERLKDVVRLQKEGILDCDSNFCFGEGGAGAFSDGKLFTRSKKRGNVKEILALLHQFGAKEEVLYESHPHIGSDLLPKVIRNIRNFIIEKGGEVYFSTKFRKLLVTDRKIEGIETEDGKEFKGPVILATGHSAHDVYEHLHAQGIPMQQKGFAMGVRLEHPQSLIDKIIYHSASGRGEFLPPAEYKMACQINGRGVYSFCMCPGGVIVPSASGQGESVVNGMSASGRSGRWANSGIVVEIRPKDFPEYESLGDLGMLKLQQDTERRFFLDSGSFNVPGQRMKDFVEGKKSDTLPRTSYVPGVHPADIYSLLPEEVAYRLKEGLKMFGKKNKGFLTNDAMLLGLESRTSSPVRIPRNPESLHHPDFKGLYPVGEGAGFSGGIVSSAIDGRRAMDAIAKEYKK